MVSDELGLSPLRGQILLFSREAEMKKRTGLLMVAGCVAWLISCGGETAPVVKDEPMKPTVIEEGWVDDNTFRVKSTAETDIASDNREERQKASEALAIKKAREGVVKNFVAIRVKKSANTNAGAYAVIAISVEKEFRDIIEGGKVIKKEFSGSDRICTVVYQIEKDGLKKMVEKDPQKK